MIYLGKYTSDLLREIYQNVSAPQEAVGHVSLCSMSSDWAWEDPLRSYIASFGFCKQGGDSEGFQQPVRPKHWQMRPEIHYATGVSTCSICFAKYLLLGFRIVGGLEPWQEAGKAKALAESFGRACSTLFTNYFESTLMHAQIVCPAIAHQQASKPKQQTE